MKLAVLLYIAVNGHLIHFGDTPPETYFGQLFVAARPVLQKMNATVTRKGDRLEVRVGDRQVTMQAGSKRVVVDGQPVWFQHAPRLVNGEFMVPLRSTMEAVGAYISWNDHYMQYKFVSIRSSTGELFRSPSKQHHTYSPDWLFSPSETRTVTVNATITKGPESDTPAFFEAVTEDGIQLFAESQNGPRPALGVGAKVRMTGAMAGANSSIFKVYSYTLPVGISSERSTR